MNDAPFLVEELRIETKSLLPDTYGSRQDNSELPTPKFSSVLIKRSWLTASKAFLKLAVVLSDSLLRDFCKCTL